MVPLSPFGYDIRRRVEALCLFTLETNERPMYPITATLRILVSLSAVLIWMTLFFLSSQVVAVEYGVRFDATWSATSHPGTYPTGAHFSPLIGVTHNDQVTFWESGDIASSGIEQMAETGGTSILQSEFNAAEVTPMRSSSQVV
jgi:hypothetical protein